jgi:membrane-bound serine protease (ClpP class)
MDEIQQAKANSAMMSMARSVAEQKGHDPRVIEAMIDPEMDLEIDGEVLFRKPVTLSAQQATMTVNGRPLFAKGIATSVEEIKLAEGLKGETVVAEPTFFENIAIWVTKYAAILILIGIAGGYLEMQTPGFGIFGIVSVCAFGLFFFGHYVAGSLVGHETTVVAFLFVIGALLLVMEFLVFPGTFFFGITGFLCILVALVYTMSAWEPMPPITAPGEAEVPAKFDFSVYAIGLRNFVLGLVGAIVIIAILARYLPESRLFSRLILAASAGGETESKPALAAVQQVQVGEQGKAVSALRPYGTVQFGDKRLEAVFEGGYLQAGTDVRVRELRDSRIIVEPVA